MFLLFFLQLVSGVCPFVANVSLAELELRSFNALDKMRDALKTSGAILVTDLPVFDTTLLLRDLKDCSSTPRSDIFSSDFPDGTHRKTLAARSAESLPDCLPNGRHIKKIADRVGAAFISAFDSTIQIGSAHLGPETLSTLAAFADAGSSDHLDHLHLYTPPDMVTDFSLPMHTDRGLFLILTPSPGLYLHCGAVEVVANSMLILLGEALPSWLGTPVVAGLHAVQVYSERAVFARMYLPPKNAESQGVIFRDFFGASEKTEKWRRLEDQECGAGEIFCWMRCVAGGSCGSQARCWDFQAERVCDPVRDEHNSNCNPRCFGLAPSTEDDSICIPGSMTTMYMDSFHWSLGDSKLPCISLFTSYIVLDETWKFFLGCLLTFVIAASIEGIVQLRETSKWSGSLFGMNMTVAYLAMLAAMTYSGELFLAVILGLVAGHVFWKNDNFHESHEPCCITAPTSLAKECPCT